MRLATRLGLRGHGGAEPNPLVGCVIVDDNGQVVGWGCHRHFGGPHAEVVALQRAGLKARGATAYVTLEPCNHVGRTGPCTEALIQAGVRRVVIARRDPNPLAAGGMQRLQATGIRVEILANCSEAIALGDPFVHRSQTGLPWVIAKWAQTIDGRIATRSGHSRWISSEPSRRLVHRERGRVDAIMTGIGTVLADNPMLTARPPAGRKPRRIARRIVIDPRLQIPLDAKVLTTLEAAPTTIACDRELIESHAPKVQAVQALGAEIMPIDLADQQPQLAPLLRTLTERHEIASVLVESGGGLLGQLFQQRLVNEAWVFTAPLLLGDEQAQAAVRGLTAERLTDGVSLRLMDQRVRGGDVVARYRIDQPPGDGAGEG